MPPEELQAIRQESSDPAPDGLPSIRELANLVPLFLDPNTFTNQRTLRVSDVRFAAAQALTVYQGCAEALEARRRQLRSRNINPIVELPEVPGPNRKPTYKAFLREIIRGKTEADQTKRLRDYLTWESGLETALGPSATEAARKERAVRVIVRLKRDFKESDWDGIGRPFTRWWEDQARAKRQARASRGGKAKAAKWASDERKSLTRPLAKKAPPKKRSRTRKQE